MNNPFRRRPVDRPDPPAGTGAPSPVEDALRASLAEHARQAPSGDGLADRIVAAAESAAPHHDPEWLPATPRRGWRTAALPLVAAAAVAVVVGGVVAIDNVHHRSGRPAGEKSSPTTSASAVVPTFTRSSVPASTTPSPTTSSALRRVQIIDLTFVNQDEGFALASADCEAGPGRCTAELRTYDGATWKSMAGAAFNVPGVKNCAAPCVEHVRFANDTVGYAYGPDALFLTGNGGRSWTEQKGLGADALETVDGSVVLVRALGTAKPLFERSDIGSTSWTSIPIPGGTFPAARGVSLARAGSTSVLALTRADPASSGLQTAAVYRSTDGQANRWTSSKDPCPVTGPGSVNVTAAATIAPDGAVVLDCARATSAGAVTRGATITSTNDGKTFVSPPGGGTLAPAKLLGAASAKVQFVVTASGKGDQLFRSADAGNSWSAVTSIPVGSSVFLGFENDQVGRFVTGGGTAVWTTRNAGVSWTKASI